MRQFIIRSNWIGNIVRVNHGCNVSSGSCFVFVNTMLYLFRFDFVQVGILLGEFTYVIRRLFYLTGFVVYE